MTAETKLTDEQIMDIAATHLGDMHIENFGIGDTKDFARAIEAAALLRAGAAKVPDVLVDQAWYWVRYEGLSGVIEAPAMYKAAAQAFYSVAFSGIPEREIEVIRELSATPPAPDAGVVEPKRGGVVAGLSDGDWSSLTGRPAHERPSDAEAEEFQSKMATAYCQACAQKGTQ